MVEIQSCRPYFISLLGERYCWVTRDLSHSLVSQEPWLADHAGSSVTELEILHGVLNDPEMAGHAFFYLRDPVRRDPEALVDHLFPADSTYDASDLLWLLISIPKGARLVLSTLPGRPLGATGPVRISDQPQAASPLFLRVLLDELRQHGAHKTLDRRLDLLLGAGSVAAPYDLVLARGEADFERERPGMVKDALAALWAALRGLSEAELLDLLGDEAGRLPHAHWTPLFLAAEGSLLDRSGLLAR